MYIRSLTFLHDTFPMDTRYPFSLAVLKKSGTLAFHQPVTFFTERTGPARPRVSRQSPGCRPPCRTEARENYFSRVTIVKIIAATVTIPTIMNSQATMVSTWS
jgi:hypothetical protein